MQHIYTILCSAIVQNKQDVYDYPLIISIIALVSSLVFNIITARTSNKSLDELRNSNKRNIRPFFTLENFSKMNNGVIVPTPNVFIVRVKNAPAKIVSLKFELVLRNIVDNSNADLGEIPMSGLLIYFPDDNVLNRLAFHIDLLNSYVSRAINQNLDLIHRFNIEYSPIDSNDIYTTQIIQKLDIENMQWLQTSISAT
ncbi:hypothetical protein [Elizabethkingia meningoseptica]|uniref:hypothetical protein n=1 Tax=Elizabethkingia meningoseptica TaxID=238 RepID=UPI0016288921|nr:hypothetical protein [Elizabethkingia meningoseptica]MBG0514108.1 hypothetical protein [Elizabethkingia meningoseptica]MDE5433025.1 hypothetical protein [Elizabethkingia meningoseptica]MDV4070306.1 hypothetical protein [Elizabethkingia anophelis]